MVIGLSPKNQTNQLYIVKMLNFRHISRLFLTGQSREQIGRSREFRGSSISTVVEPNQRQIRIAWFKTQTWLLHSKRPKTTIKGRKMHICKGDKKTKKITFDTFTNLHLWAFTRTYSIKSLCQKP